jgi:hypothetical protein
MAWSKSLNTAVPAGTDSPTEGDDVIRSDKSGWQERLNVDHFFEESANLIDDLDCGKHRQVTFYGVLAEDPTLETGETAFYTKTVSGISELFWKDSAGSVKQLSSGGKINISALEAVLLTGDQTIAGVKTFNSPPVSATQPTTDSQVANKAYVDDTVAAATPQVTKSASAAKIVHADGLVEQIFSISSTDDGDQAFTFPEAFSTACIAVFFSHSVILELSNVTIAGFTVNRWDEIQGTLSIYVRALGY